MVYTFKGEKAPPGYKLIEQTPSGRSANLVPSSKGVFLAVRRQDGGREDGALGYALEPAVMDVCVLLTGRGEVMPDGFVLLDKAK